MLTIGIVELLVVLGFVCGMNITLIGIIYNMNVRRIDALADELRRLHECMDRRSSIAAELRVRMASDITELRTTLEFVRQAIVGRESI